jgi:hypothetical protein
MSYKKVLEVAKKFADAQEAQNLNQKFQEQRVRTNHFFDVFIKQFSESVSLIESDIHTLKLKGFDNDTLKIMAKLLSNLQDYRKHLYNKDRETGTFDIYPRVQKISNYVLDRNNLAIIDNLEFLTQHFMKNNQVDFLPSKLLTQSKLNGLKLLKRTVLAAKEYMDKNPLLSAPGSNPPPMIMEPNQFGDEIKAGPTDATNPGIPVKKNPQAAE